MQNAEQPTADEEVDLFHGNLASKEGVPEGSAPNLPGLSQTLINRAEAGAAEVAATARAAVSVRTPPPHHPINYLSK